MGKVICQNTQSLSKTGRNKNAELYVFFSRDMKKNFFLGKKEIEERGREYPRRTIFLDLEDVVEDPEP